KQPLSIQYPSAFNPACTLSQPWGLSVRPNNNCYNFAANSMTGTFAQPGRGGGRQAVKPHGCDSVHAGLKADGYWIDSGCFVPIDLSQYATAIIALVVRPDGLDYHFYRLVAAWDNGRVWAHKPGQTN